MYAGQSQGVRSGAGIGSRLPEVREALKAEFEQLNHEAVHYKAQRDESERKRTTSISEKS